MIPVKYADNVRNLTNEQIDHLCRSLLLEDQFQDGDALLAFCKNSDLDHADLVWSIRNECSFEGIKLIEDLIGKPITRPTPKPEKTTSAPKTKRTRKPKHDPRVVVNVIPNPKRKGAAPYERYENYRVGMTVMEAIEAGVTMADVEWDSHPKRQFITLADPESKEALAARGAYLK